MEYQIIEEATGEMCRDCGTHLYIGQLACPTYSGIVHAACSRGGDADVCL